MDAFILSGCVGVSLFVAMVFSSLVGVVIPMFFHKIKVDPAVASGPLITSINDFVAVVTYYGLAWILLFQVFHVHLDLIGPFFSHKKSPPEGRHKKRTWQLAIVASSHYRRRYDA